MLGKRKPIREEIEIPEGIDVKLIDGRIKMSRESSEIERKLNFPIRQENKKLIIEKEKPTKKDKKLIKSDVAHIRNMLDGLEKKFIYKLQICSVHFPMGVSVSENEAIIKNFLGEEKERRAKILPGVEVKIDRDIITVESSDKEKAGQTSANIENATKIKKRDRRVFQDGIFIISKEKGRRKK